MEFAAILIEHEIFGNCSQSIDRSIVRLTLFDGIRNFNQERDFWQPCSMEFAAILMEHEIFGNRSRLIH